MAGGKIMSTTTTFFKLGEGLDYLVRQAYWYENRQEWALSVLDCLVGMTEQQKTDVLNGDVQLIPIDDGKKLTLLYEPNEQFKKELKEHKEWLASTHITIAGKTIYKRLVDTYVEFVIKRYRMAVYNPGLFVRIPNIVMTLEQTRKSIHDAIIEEAGFKEREGEDYLKFSTELSELVEKEAGKWKVMYESSQLIGEEIE